MNKKVLYLFEKPIVKVGLMTVVAILGIVLIWFKFFNKSGLNSDKKFAHTDPEIIKEVTLDELKFTNIMLLTDSGYTTFSATVINTSNEPSSKEKVNINLKDSDGKTVITLLGYIDKKLNPNESTVINASAKGEFKNVKSKEIKNT